MTTPQRDLFLIAGIPGTGKTTFGEALAKEFGFAHYDLEEPKIVNRCATDPARFIDEIMQDGSNVVVTWGFVPDHAYSVQTVLQFRQSGFKMVWFDGNRSAALAQFRKRGTVSDPLFQLQMKRIENSAIIDRLRPAVVNPFDEHERFKPANELLEEIRRM